MIQDSRKLLRALDNLTNETIHAEQYFTDELHLFFQYLCRKVLKELDLKNPLDSLFHLEPNNIIEKYWEEYDKIFSYYVDVGATIGNIHYDILLNASKAHAKEFASTKSRETVQSLLDYKFNSEDTDTLFKPDPKVSSRLKRYKFEASEKTKARVTEDINNILGEAYREGWGPRHVGEKIQERFNQLSGYEARRIAQTELNTTRNMVQYNRLKDDEMPYKIWHSAHDARTRKSHLDVDEEIVPIDEKFSNGLMYPGDKSGPIREWVNCRCSHAAFIMPLGYEAPSFFPFRESDLVKVGSSVSSSYIPELRERLGLVEGLVQGVVQSFDQEKFDKLKTHEEVAEFFGFEYNPEGKKYSNLDAGKNIEFYDPKHDVSIRFFTEGEYKIKELDFKNEGRGYNVKQALKDYYDAPKNLKYATDDISYIHRERTFCGGECKGLSVNIYQGAFDSPAVWEQKYNVSFKHPSHALHHEMTHALDKALSLSLSELKSMTHINSKYKQKWAEATQKDYAHQKKSGLDKMDSSEYGAEKQVEDFAEMGATYISHSLGVNHSLYLGYEKTIKREVDGRMRRTKEFQTVEECISANPNRAKLMQEILEDETINFKQIKLTERDKFTKFLQNEENL